MVTFKDSSDNVGQTDILRCICLVRPLRVNFWREPWTHHLKRHRTILAKQGLRECGKGPVKSYQTLAALRDDRWSLLTRITEQGVVGVESALAQAGGASETSQSWGPSQEFPERQNNRLEGHSVAQRQRRQTGGGWAIGR